MGIRDRLQAEVPGVGHAGVCLVHQQDAAVRFAELLADGQALIFGAVVDDDELEVLVLLPADAFEAAAQEMCIRDSDWTQLDWTKL